VTRTIADLTDRDQAATLRREGLDTGTSTGRVVAGIITSLAKLDLEHERRKKLGLRGPLPLSSPVSCTTAPSPAILHPSRQPPT
jgi:hypothetical protein